MKVFKFVLFSLFISMSGILTGCGFAVPDAGEAAVLIDKPIVFGHGGVRDEAIETGLAWIWWTTNVEYVNIYPQQFDINFEDMMSSDGIPLDFQASLRLKVNDPVALIRNFGKDWYMNNIEKEFAIFVRAEVKKHTMQAAAIDGKATEAIDDALTKNVDEYIKRIKMPVDLISVTLGRANPPDPVKNQRIETAQQEQRRITEDKREAAERSRKLAEEARAESDNAYRNKMNLSPAQFVELERIKMMQTVCEGKAGVCTFIIGGDVAPVVNVR
jgi:regulator of protease activity HflC (stomatin/prohibitin superfamily)